MRIQRDGHATVTEEGEVVFGGLNEQVHVKPGFVLSDNLSTGVSYDTRLAKH